MTEKIIEGSGNIFADLGHSDAGAHMMKAKIVAEIYRIAKAENMTQTAVGKRLHITQPEVSRMFRGNFREYGFDRLLGFLRLLGREARITFHARPPAAKGPRRQARSFGRREAQRVAR